MRLLYDSGIAYTDAHIGQLLESLKKSGMYDKSLIMVMADHGEEFAEHGNFFHGNNLYDDVLHVPLVVKMPNQREGKRVGGIFPLIDLYPSIARLAGVKASEKRIQGREEDLSGAVRPRDNYVFSTLNTGPELNQRSAEYKGMRFVYDFATHKKELYDLKTDPIEQKNLVSERPKESDTFYRDLMSEERAIAGSYAGKYTSREERMENMTKGLRDKLKTLGYAQ